MTAVSRCIEYAKRAKREGCMPLHRFYLRKARATINFNRGLKAWDIT
jgi:hypothetical protein